MQFQKKYQSDIEEKFRMKIFMENKHKINRHNRLYEQGEESYQLAMNHFGDLVSSKKNFFKYETSHLYITRYSLEKNVTYVVSL